MPGGPMQGLAPSYGHVHSHAHSSGRAAEPIRQAPLSIGDNRGDRGHVAWSARFIRDSTPESEPADWSAAVDIPCSLWASGAFAVTY